MAQAGVRAPEQAHDRLSGPRLLEALNILAQ